MCLFICISFETELYNSSVKKQSLINIYNFSKNIEFKLLFSPQYNKGVSMQKQDFHGLCPYAFKRNFRLSKRSID